MSLLHRVVALVPALVACAAPLESEPAPIVDAPSAAPLRLEAAARGFPDAVALVELASRNPHAQRFVLAWDGVPIPGVGGVVRRDLPYARLAAPRLDLEAPPITTPTIDEGGARDAALATLPDAQVVGATLVLRPVFERRRRADVDDRGRASTATDFEQVIRRLALRWLVTLERDGAPRRWLVEVDAVDGTATPPRPDRVDLAPAELREVTAFTRYHGTVPIRVGFDPEADDGPYQLVDRRGNEFHAGGSVYTSPDPRFGDGHHFIDDDALDTSNAETAAVDAFVAVDVTWKMFQDVLALDGPLGGSGDLIIELHHQIANAWWDPALPGLHVGYRDLALPWDLWPMTTTDVIGHELGHGFFMAMTETTTFDYLLHSELAGLSEATGDIIGTLAEHHRATALAPLSAPSPNFAIGEQMIATDGAPYIRSMIAPTFPVWTPELYWEDPHEIAGPINRMFYVLARGLDPYRPHALFASPERMSEYLPDGLAGIGTSKAGMIWRDTVMVLGLGDDPASSRGAALEVTVQRHGRYSIERKAVADAFAAVNIGPPADRIAPIITDPSSAQIVDAIRVEFTLQDPSSMAQRPPRVVVDGAVMVTAIVPGHGGGLPPITPLPTRYRADVPTARLSADAHDGEHTAVIEAWDDWGNRSALTLTFTAELTRPIVTVSLGGSGKLPIITATATDASGVVRVELSRGGTLLQTDVAAPYVFPLDTSTWADGGHALTVAAFDPHQNRGTAPVMITADNTAPVATVTASGAEPPFAVTATAIDASPLVAATFLRDGAPTVTDTVAPFQTAYAPQDSGAHTLGVRVRDSFGNEGSASIMAPRDLTGPQLTVDAVQWQGAVTLTGAATDPCGLQLPMVVRVDGTVVAQPSTASFSVTLPNALFIPGPHVLTVDVGDRCGNARHGERPFAIYLNTPVVVATRIDTGDPKAPRVAATTVHDRPIARVVFRRTHATGALTLGEDTTAPYELTLDTSAWPDGLHAVEAMAFDEIGWGGLDVVDGIRADNTPPAVAVGWRLLNRVLYFEAVPTDGADGAGLEPGVRMNVLVFGSPITDLAAPYLYQLAIPNGRTQGTFLFTAWATDQFGNQGSGSVSVQVSCTPNRCTAL